MLGDLVNGAGCLAEGSEANNPLSKLSKAVAHGPMGGKQPMHHGQQQQPLMGLHGGPSSMHGMLPSMGPEEESFMQAFHAAPAEEVAAELSRAWASSHGPGHMPPGHMPPGHMPGHMHPGGATSSAHDGAWLEAGNLNGAWNEAHASQQAVASSHEAARLQPLQQQAGQALHGQLRGMMGNPMMPALPAEVRHSPRALPAPPPLPPRPPWAAPHPDRHTLPRGPQALLAGMQGLPPEQQAAAARRADRMAAHLHPAGAQELWAARPAQNGSSQMSVLPPTPPWRTADVDSYPPQQLGGGGMPYGVSQQHEAAWASSAAAAGQLGEAVPRSVTAPMIAAMQGSDDPRFQQSQLLDMLKQMDAGKVQLGEAELHSAAQAPELDAAWGEAGAAGAARQAGSPFDSAWSQAADQAGDGEGMMQAWHDALHEDGIDSSLPEMEALWAALKGGETGDFEAAWDPSLLEAGYDDYCFAAVNPFLGQEVPGGLLALGTELFARGELSQAVLALEAAVQQNPDDSIAWQTLGQTHADSDEDNRAIGCLRRAVSSDPHNLEALLALGVSYTNELDQSRALHHLQHWLESHPDFASLGLAVEPAAKANPFRLQQQVTDNFARAVAHAPSNADLHAVLGVLYNLSRDYPAAVGAFEAALQLRPTDYSLWNKLGATQANSMECAKALPCYVNALELKPQYVRALSNLGISYSNMMSYDAAGSCYLKALSLNPEAKHIWSYLGMTLTSMGRPDLVDKVIGQNVEAFRGDFDF